MANRLRRPGVTPSSPGSITTEQVRSAIDEDDVLGINVTVLGVTEDADGLTVSVQTPDGQPLDGDAAVAALTDALQGSAETRVTPAVPAGAASWTAPHAVDLPVDPTRAQNSEANLRDALATAVGSTAQGVDLIQIAPNDEGTTTVVFGVATDE